jgi:hypothetical protein
MLHRPVESAADLRRSELNRRPHLEPSGIFTHLYRISTAHNSSDVKRLFLRAFPANPEIIEHSICGKTLAEYPSLIPKLSDQGSAKNTPAVRATDVLFPLPSATP